MAELRIATYNIHKCVGMDRRYSPERIVEVLREIDADVIGLQEVLCRTHLRSRDRQAEFIADSLGMEFCFGENRKIKGAGYGNVILSRMPISKHHNYDITVDRREPRGCLRAEIELGLGKVLQFINVHMGTSYFERRKQVAKMLARHALHDPAISGSRIVAGDFNEWISGVTTKLFRLNFNSVDARADLGMPRTFPGLLPMVHLDHVYYDDAFTLRSARVHRSRKALLASDHLPIVADFEV